MCRCDAEMEIPSTESTAVKYMYFWVTAKIPTARVLCVKFRYFIHKNQERSSLSLFNDISKFSGYLTAKPSM